MSITWAILTGEYPPQEGGVADYTQQVARGLVEAGDQVHVFVPPADPSGHGDDGVHVHRLTANFDNNARSRVADALRSLPQPRRVLVQYVPHAFGYRAMNFRFARWIRRLASHEAVDVMFHEVAYPLEPDQKMKHRLLALVNRRMARWLGTSADRVFISIQAWKDLLREIGVSQEMQWLPVPTNITRSPDPAAVAAVRTAMGTGTLIAHFGTYGQRLTALEDTFHSLIERDPKRTLLLLGRGGSEFAAGFIAAHSSAAGRVHATGPLNSAAVAAHLAASDLMVQPYPDGISCRRSSAMAGLALGVPIVTCHGHLTESIWAESNAIALAPTPAAADIAAFAEALLADDVERKRLGEGGRSLYDERFSINHTIEALRSLASAAVE